VLVTIFNRYFYLTGAIININTKNTVQIQFNLIKHTEKVAILRCRLFTWSASLFSLA